MSSDKTYTLEYWIDSKKFSEDELDEYITQKLQKFLPDIVVDIKYRDAGYFVSRITSTERLIDACHEKLDFDGEWAFRAKDELGDLLRSKAYPILAEIELCLRAFIFKATSEVLGFDWWNPFIPTHIGEKVEGVQARAGPRQVESHHAIEFTTFEELIKIVTGEFQAWRDERTISASDLYQLLNGCDSVEDIRKEVDNRRKVVSFWDDVFSYYFADKDAWTQLKKHVKKHVIDTRNKVMHHRIFRKYELKELKDCRDEVNRTIGRATSELSYRDLADAQQNISKLVEALSWQLDPVFWKRLQEPLIAISQVSEAIRRPLIDPEFIEALSKPSIYLSQLSEALRGMSIAPEVVQAWSIPLIDAASMARIGRALSDIPMPESGPSTTEEEE